MPGADVREVFFWSGLAGAALAGLVLLALLRRWLRWPGGGTAAEDAGLHPHEAVALGNGRSTPVNAALTRLVQDGVLAFDAREWTLSARGALPASAHRLERAIYDAVVANPEAGRFDAALVALLRS